MGDPEGKIVVICGFRSDGTLKAVELTDSDELKIAISTAVGSDLLTSLQSLQNLVGALHSVGVDFLDVHVHSSVLPPLAATTTNQGLIYTELQQKLETADLELVSKILSIGSHGWVGGAWQRQPINLGYSGDKTQQIWTVNASDGDNQIILDPVPAGEIWDVQMITAKNMNKVCTFIQLIAYVNTISLTLLMENDPVIATDTYWNGHLTLSYQDRIVVNYGDCDLNDDLYTRFHAVKIDIDQ